MTMRLCAAFLLLISNGCFWGTDFEKMGPEVGIHFDSDLDLLAIRSPGSACRFG